MSSMIEKHAFAGAFAAATSNPWSAVAAIFAFVLLVTMALVPAAREFVRVRLKGGLPRPPVWTTGLPVIGSFLAFASNPVGTVRRARKELGGPECFTLSLVSEGWSTTNACDQAHPLTPSFGNRIATFLAS